MGRRKVPNPKQAKTISLPKYMWDSIDLHAKNRSYYIERCIGKQMNDILELEEYDVREFSTKQIATLLLDRLSNEDYVEEQFKFRIDLRTLIKEMN